MKRKILILLLMLFILTGCDAVYRLEYTNNTLKETFTVKNLDEFKSDAESVYSFDLTTNFNNESDLSREDAEALGYKFYEKSLNEDNGLSLQYYYNFSKDDYNNSFIAKNFFPKINFYNETLYSGNINDVYSTYPNLGSITIEFYTDKNVVMHNADKLIDNTYFWYLNKDNYKNKKIELIFSEKDNSAFDVIKKEIQTIKDDENFDWTIIFILLGVIFLIIFVYVFIKVKNSNKK